MRILFYTQFNSRSLDTESVMEALVNNAHEVFLLTQCKKGNYHIASEKLGVKTFEFTIPKSSFLYFFKHALFLIKFCKKNNIDYVFSHLENASLSAVIAQFFIRAKVITFRHIVDEAYLLKSKRFILQNKIVYHLSKKIVVVSNRSKQFMVEIEKINQGKICVINLAYNFNLYSQPNEETVNIIKSTYNNNLIILTAGRLLDAKRPDVSISVVESLIKKKYNVKLLILGDGPNREKLQNLILKKNLQDYVYLLGFKNNIIDYLSACDILLHPSILDSSSVIIKEAGLLKKTVIACKEVGDVDEYFINGINGYLVQKINPEEEILTIITNYINNPNSVGENLHKDVLRLFSIENNFINYINLLKNE